MVRVSETSAPVAVCATTRIVCGPEVKLTVALNRPSVPTVTAAPFTVRLATGLSTWPDTVTGEFVYVAPFAGWSTTSCGAGWPFVTGGFSWIVRDACASLPDGSRTWTSMWFDPGLSGTTTLNVPSRAGRTSLIVSRPGETRTVIRPSGFVFPFTVYSAIWDTASPGGSVMSTCGATAKFVNW